MFWNNPRRTKNNQDKQGRFDDLYTYVYVCIYNYLIIPLVV